METYTVGHETWSYIVGQLDELSDTSLQVVLDQLEKHLEKFPMDGDAFVAIEFVKHELDNRELAALSPQRRREEMQLRQAL